MGKGELSHVDGRTGREWLRSAIAYCDWRAGESWRRLSDAIQRNSPERWYYLDGSRFLESVLNAPLAVEPNTIHVPLPVLDPAPTISPFEQELATKPRAVLVGLLLAADPNLTNRKLLSGLSRPKLARMIVQARAARAADDESLAGARRA